MTVSHPVARTAFYCCILRADDAASPLPVCGDALAARFVDEDVRRAQADDPGRANELSVRQELQADCLAGVWSYTAEERGLVQAGDLEEALQAASAIGDDRIQEASGTRVNPESWTHGSAAQRSRWFRAGFEGGEIAACDTFRGDV